MSASDSPSLKLTGSAPVLRVVDVVKTAEWYRDVLGFDHEQLWGEPPCFCMPKRDGLVLMLTQVCEPTQAKPNSVIDGTGETWDVYFWITDAAALFAEFTGKGAEVAYAPVIRDYYQMKEFAVKDPDGHILAFGQHWPASS